VRRKKSKLLAEMRAQDLLETGRRALASGAWPEARHAFESLVSVEEHPEALEGLGLAAWWLDQADLVFDARERAYRAYREREDPIAAARVAVWLAWDHAAFRGEEAVANGWLQRARRLLDTQPDAPEHAWLSVRQAAFSLLDHGDPEEAQVHAAEAIRVGQAVGSVDFEMVGRSLRGFALVTAGRVAEGMQILDEVNAAVVAGELTDRVAIGLACCYLIAACDRVRDYDRAAQWCDRLKAFCAKWGLRPLFAVCRTQYASLCMWRGAWAEAEQELATATDELAASRPAMTSEGLARLAELRRRQGRLDEAAELFEQAGSHPIAALGRAALALDRGEHKAAGELAERHLRHLSVHNRTERASALELLIRAQIGLGNIDQAGRSMTELSAIATEAATVPLRASARFGAGLIAFESGALDDARRQFEDAVDLFQQSGAPFEMARVRIELARTLGELGRTDAALQEVQRALTLLTPMSAELELSRARALFDRLSVSSVEPARPIDRGGLTLRELEVLRLISTGMSNQAIANQLFISEHTVHRHVSNTLSKLGVPSRSAAVAHAARRGLL
jgi:DNA-binding CsgD family transcriptional regulator